MLSFLNFLFLYLLLQILLLVGFWCSKYTPKVLKTKKNEMSNLKKIWIWRHSAINVPKSSLTYKSHGTLRLIKSSCIWYTQLRALCLQRSYFVLRDRARQFYLKVMEELEENLKIKSFRNIDQNFSVTYTRSIQPKSEKIDHSRWQGQKIYIIIKLKNYAKIFKIKINK